MVVLALVSLGVWTQWPEPEPEEIADQDTGLSIEQQELLMQEIGYLQQE